MKSTEIIRRTIGQLNPDEQRLAASKLDRMIRRRKAVARFPTPGHLSQFLRPDFVQTDMLDVIDRCVMDAYAGVHKRFILNTPPQMGKTSRLQDAALWLLLRRPWLSIVFASYEQSIAGRSTLATRQFLEQHGSGYRGMRKDPFHHDTLGLELDPVQRLKTQWQLSDCPDGSGRAPGSMTAVGVGGALTGRRADVIVVDDPIKDSKHADSPVIRQAIKDWYQSVALTRLSPAGVVIVVQTRWHEDDLSGWLLEGDTADDYVHINIPAQAEADDALGRKPGEYLTSTRGHTAEDWEATKKAVGTRVWFSLYQGHPSAPEGAIFKRRWFRHETPPELTHIVTMIDPADNVGDGDEAGIVTGGTDGTGHAWILADDSGHYTRGQWYRVALYAMFRNNSHRLCYEQSLSGLRRSMRAEWRTMRIQARTLTELHQRLNETADFTGLPSAKVIEAAVGKLADADDGDELRTELRDQLLDMWPWVPRVLAMPPSGPPLKHVKAEGTKSYRANLVSPSYENGSVKHAKALPELEEQMATWQEGQDSPDRMDAAVHLVLALVAVTPAATKAPPGTIPKRARNAGARSSIPTRSVGRNR